MHTWQESQSLGSQTSWVKGCCASERWGVEGITIFLITILMNLTALKSYNIFSLAPKAAWKKKITKYQTNEREKKRLKRSQWGLRAGCLLWEGTYLLGNQSPRLSTFIQHLTADLLLCVRPYGTGPQNSLFQIPKSLQANGNTAPTHHNEDANEGTYNVNGNGRGRRRKPPQDTWNVSWAGRIWRALQGSWKKTWRRRQKRGVGVLGTSKDTKGGQPHFGDLEQET